MFTSRATFIGYGSEDKTEYDRLVNDDEYDNVVYINREHVEGTKMKRVHDTLLISQVQGSTVKNPVTGKHVVETSYLPCACTTCRLNPSNHENCVYSEYRRTSIVNIKMEQDRSAPDPNDPFDLCQLNVTQLKLELNGRGFETPGRWLKKELVLTLTEIMHHEMERDDCNY